MAFKTLLKSTCASVKPRCAFKALVHIVERGPGCFLGTFMVCVGFPQSNLERRHPMATNPGPRAPYRDERRNIYREPRSSFSDNASVFWTIVAAALAAVLLIWLFTATSVRTLDSIDTSAVPSEATQPVTHPHHEACDEPRTRSVSSSLESDSAGRCLAHPEQVPGTPGGCGSA